MKINLEPLLTIGLALLAVALLIAQAKRFHLIERINDRSDLPFCDDPRVVDGVLQLLRDQGEQVIRRAMPSAKPIGEPLVLADLDFSTVTWTVDETMQIHFDHKTQKRNCGGRFKWQGTQKGKPVGQDIVWIFLVLENQRGQPSVALERMD